MCEAEGQEVRSPVLTGKQVREGLLGPRRDLEFYLVW